MPLDSQTERPAGRANFLASVIGKVVTDSHKFVPDNTDYVRHPAGGWERFKRQCKDRLLRFASRRNFVYQREHSLQRYNEKLAAIIEQADKLESFYDSLRDEPSKHLLVELLSYKVLGPQRVKLSTNNPEYWQAVDLVERRLLKKNRTLKMSQWPGFASYFELQEAGFPLRLHASTLSVLNTFLLRQYHYRKSDREVKVEAGDVVIDAGGCWGDTALYFAYLTGGGGRVFSFEFLHENLKVFNSNLELNNDLKEIITVVPHAVWDRSDEYVSCRGEGPSATLVAGDSSADVRTKSVDDFVREEKLQRVDFIKMDIEGAELRALRGAEQTLRAFRPKLAISLYHRDDDMISIPEFIAGLDLRYQFFLDHFTIHNEETVLFGLPRD